MHEIWERAAGGVQPRELAQRFDSQALNAIESALQSDDHKTLADALNPSFEGLGILSHTRLYDTRHQTYYMLRSVFSTYDLDAPQLYTIGVQPDENDRGAIRVVMGFARAGSPQRQAFYAAQSA